MKEQVRQRIESLERELQGLKDELQLEVIVGSWWEGDFSCAKVEVTKIDKEFVYGTYENGTKSEWSSSEFTGLFTPCEAPKKETWYLCTKDLEKYFTRGKEYKMVGEDPLRLIDEEGDTFFVKEWEKHFVSPQER